MSSHRSAAAQRSTDPPALIPGDGRLRGQPSYTRRAEPQTSPPLGPRLRSQGLPSKPAANPGSGSGKHQHRPHVPMLFPR
ncbi:unnamed protein product [Merluccius merluccius]